MKERGTVRKSMLLKTAAAAGALGLLLTGCGGDEIPPPGSENEGGGNSSENSSGWDPADDVFPVMKDWTGCDVLNDVQPVQDYLGVTEIPEGLIDAAIGEGIDGEAMTCSGTFYLATYDADDYSNTGNARIQAGVVPWETPDIAAENFQKRLEMLEESQASGGTEYTDVQSGELGGTWDESYYETGDTGTATEINAYGRSGQWIVYVLLYVGHDPGLSADDEPVYPFTTDELIDWVVNDYMVQAQSDILEKIESEK